VSRLDAFSGVKVRNRAGNLQDAVVCARGKTQLRNGVLQQLFALGGNRTELADHFGIIRALE
jgi:hypothetical protein